MGRQPLSTEFLSVNLYSCRAEAARASCGIIQIIDLGQICQLYRRYHNLGNPVAAFDDEIILAMVDQNDLQFAAIVPAYWVC